MIAIRSQQGFTLLEMMTAVGISTVLIIIVMGISQDVFKNLIQNRLSTSRNQIVISTRQSATELRALSLATTKPENAQFKACVCGSATACNSAVPYPITLYDAGAKDRAMPNYYDTHGNACDNSTQNCLIEVTTSFMAQCKPTLPDADPLPPATCIGQPAEFVTVIYIIKQNPDTLEQGNLLSSMQGAVYSMTADIAASGACL